MPVTFSQSFRPVRVCVARLVRARRAPANEFSRASWRPNYAPASCRKFRRENRPANRPASRETGLEMPCFPASDLLWVQITQSYPNRLRFWILPSPESPCVIRRPCLQKRMHRKNATSSWLEGIQTPRWICVEKAMLMQSANASARDRLCWRSIPISSVSHDIDGIITNICDSKEEIQMQCTEMGLIDRCFYWHSNI